jgi:signal transduction histidine kinase
MRLTLVQEAQAASIVLICQGDGLIKRIVRDTIGLDEIVTTGKHFTQVMEPGSTGRARAFIESLRLCEPIEEWQLNVRVFARNVTLSFVGCAVRFNHILVMGANSRSGLIRSCEERLECDYDAEFPESALNQFLASLRSDPPPAPKSFDNNAKLYNELETMQRELNLRSMELSRAAEERNRLYAMVAHDLRSPLAAIDGYADLMLDGDDIDLKPDIRESLHRIKTSGGFAINLIDSMLDPSAIESGRLQLKKSPIKLSGVICDALKINEIFARRRNVRLDAALADELNTACVDPARIAQVINHLIGNAIKYSPEGGVVCVSLAQSTSTATVSVRDQGPGISRARLARMLATGALQEVGAAKPPKPIGIGLALCRKVVNAHGGQLEVESEPGHGATFSVVLPLAQPPHNRGVLTYHSPVVA